MIEIKSLVKEYSLRNRTELAVDDVSLKVSDGEFLTLVGPSGSGKSSILRCVAGLEEVTSGDIVVNNQSVVNTPPEKRNLAMMFQSIALYPHMTIEENIAYPLKIKGVSKDNRLQQAEETAQVLGMPNMLDKYPGELSGGQQQRAALARTIVQEPDGFLMDEPLSDLDAKLKTDIRQVIQRVHKRLNTPTIYVTHDQEEAMAMSDRIAIVHDGEIVQVGDAGELYDKPETRFVGNFIGNPSMNFFSGTIETSEGRSALQINNNTFRLERSELPDEIEKAKKSIIIGVRPEDISLQSGPSDNGFSAKVILIERVGNQQIITMEGSQGEFQAVVPSQQEITEGETTDVSLNSHAFLFDPDTEKRLDTVWFDNGRHSIKEVPT